MSPASPSTGSVMARASEWTPARKVRYANVALGRITQKAVMPGIFYTEDSKVVALVTSHPDKARVLPEQYGIEAAYGYDAFDEMLRSGRVDAVYLATRSWRPAELAIRTLKAGIHVLCEKPLEVSLGKSREILDAQKLSRAKLMTAYRLHFEPVTLDLIARVRAGEFGDVMVLTSTFGQVVSPDDHRAQHSALAGPILDLGPDAVNAARNIFEEEPTEVVSAVGSSHPRSGFAELVDTVAVTLRFPGGLAQVVLPYFLNALDSYLVAGTKGSIQVNPRYQYGVPLKQQRRIGEAESDEAYEVIDQFGGQFSSFSDCLLEGRDTEPGFADLRFIEAKRRMPAAAAVTCDARAGGTSPCGRRAGRLRAGRLSTPVSLPSRSSHLPLLRLDRSR